MMPQFADMTLSSGFVAGPSFMSISNTPVWVFPNIWRLGRVRDIKFNTNVSNKKLTNAAKCQGYNFYCFWVIKGKSTGGKITPQPRLIEKIARIVNNFILILLTFFVKSSIVDGCMGHEYISNMF